MALFSAKNYATIVAPLKKMVSDLTSYINEQNDKIVTLQSQREKINSDISNSEMEINKSTNTVSKINSLLGEDLDNDGIPDVDQVPVDSTSEDKTID